MLISSQDCRPASSEPRPTSRSGFPYPRKAGLRGGWQRVRWLDSCKWKNLYNPGWPETFLCQLFKLVVYTAPIPQGAARRLISVFCGRTVGRDSICSNIIVCSARPSETSAFLGSFYSHARSNTGTLRSVGAPCHPPFLQLSLLSCGLFLEPSLQAGDLCNSASNSKKKREESILLHVSEREGVDVRFVGSNQPPGMDPHVTGEFKEGGSLQKVTRDGGK